MVKNAASDMNVFIDEFVTKIAEYYGGPKVRASSSTTNATEGVLEFIA